MENELLSARELLLSGGYTCVLLRGSETYTSTARGVKPLLTLLDSGRELSGCVAADKVVGKATAYLYVLLGARAVHAQVISRPAIEVLDRYGITAQWETAVEAIQNRDKTGFCPMESAVRGIDEPQAALDAIRTALRRLQQNG